MYDMCKMWSVAQHTELTVPDSYVYGPLNGWTLSSKIYRQNQNIRKTKADVPQGSVSGTVLSLIYASDLLTSDNTTTATFADVTAILATHEGPAIASVKLQAKKWRIKINRSKCTQITFILPNKTCPTVQMHHVEPPQKEVKYLGMHLYRSVRWAKHIKTIKKRQLNQRNPPVL